MVFLNKEKKYKFRFFDLLFAPYCYFLAVLQYHTVSNWFEVSDRLFKLFVVIAFISAYPIFAKGRTAYWKWIGEWSFSKWLMVVVLASAIFFLF